MTLNREKFECIDLAIIELNLSKGITMFFKILYQIFVNLKALVLTQPTITTIANLPLGCALGGSNKCVPSAFPFIMNHASKSP